MNASEIAEAYLEAYAAGRPSTRTKRSILFRMIEGVACVTMAAAVALSLALVAQLVGIYPS